MLVWFHRAGDRVCVYYTHFKKWRLKEREATHLRPQLMSGRARSVLSKAYATSTISSYYSAAPYQLKMPAVVIRMILTCLVQSPPPPMPWSLHRPPACLSSGSSQQQMSLNKHAHKSLHLSDQPNQPLSVGGLSSVVPTASRPWIKCQELGRWAAKRHIWGCSPGFCSPTIWYRTHYLPLNTSHIKICIVFSF